MHHTTWYLVPWARPSYEAGHVAWIRRVVCLSTLILMASTWPLWTPQEVFPQVPLLAIAGRTPSWLEWGCLGFSALCLLVATLDRRDGRFWRPALWGFAGSLFLLWLIDQHRLQPWAYQSFFFAIVLAAVERHRAVALLRLFTISIYGFSAVSKLDYTFLHSLGQQFTEALLQGIGGSSAGWSESQRVGVALLFPLGELGVALLLSLARTRHLGIAAAIVMHLVLILVLGPFGMHQQPAVLLWNFEFIVLVCLLFGTLPNRSPDAEEPATEANPTEQSLRRRTWPGLAVEALLLLAIAAPVLEPFGWCDLWLAWGLYSPGASRAIVSIHDSDEPHLPESIRNFRSPEIQDASNYWYQLRLDHWSLQSLRVPIYPQARFQLGAAIAVQSELPATIELRVDLYSAADRFTGQRTVQTLHGTQQLENAARRYWLNALPGNRWFDRQP